MFHLLPPCALRLNRLAMACYTLPASFAKRVNVGTNTALRVSNCNTASRLPSATRRFINGIKHFVLYCTAVCLQPYHEFTPADEQFR